MIPVNPDRICAHWIFAARCVKRESWSYETSELTKRVELRSKWSCDRYWSSRLVELRNE